MNIFSYSKIKEKYVLQIDPKKLVPFNNNNSVSNKITDLYKKINEIKFLKNPNSNVLKYNSLNTYLLKKDSKISQFSINDYFDQIPKNLLETEKYKLNKDKLPLVITKKKIETKKFKEININNNYHLPLIKLTENTKKSDIINNDTNSRTTRLNLVKIGELKIQPLMRKNRSLGEIPHKKKQAKKPENIFSNCEENEYFDFQTFHTKLDEESDEDLKNYLKENHL